MNCQDIEVLKSLLLNMAGKGCRLVDATSGTRGSLIGVGFKPYWTDMSDSKIEKLEFNVMDARGRIIPINFFNVVGYDIVSYDGKRFEDSANISFDIHVFSVKKSRSREHYDKVRIDVALEES